MFSAAELTSYVHKQIPITKAMGIEVTAYCGKAVHAAAPLQQNINHQESAFGGSIATLGIVTGFVIVMASLRAHDKVANVVIQHSETEFSKPALGNMESETRPLS
ncbi:MAG: thioesterase domain-containing protein, partial [Planctomycetales bacterium]